MSTESVSPDYAALLKRVEAIENDAQAMRQAHSQSRLARLLVLLLLTVATVVFVYLFIGLALRFADRGRQRDFAAVALNQFFEVVDLDKRTQAEEAEDWDELLNQYTGMLAKEAEDLGKTSIPVVHAAFRNQMNRDMGKHRAMFNEQRGLLVRNVQEKGEELLEARYQVILDQHKAILQSEFEDLDDEKIERMLAHFNIAMERLLRKYYGDEIEGQANRLSESFDDFPISDPPGSGESLEQQLLGTTLELLQVKLAGDPIVAVDSEESSAPSVAGETKGTEEPAEAGKQSQDEAVSDKTDAGNEDQPRAEEETTVSLEDKDARDAQANEADAGDTAESDPPDGQSETIEKESTNDSESENP